MNCTEGRFSAANGAQIHYRYWRPTNARALLFLVHGAGEHSGRYGYFVDWFGARGYAIAALDHPGHGLSTGRRGHIRRFQDYLDTLERFHRKASEDFPGIPTFLVGHSMGGLIATHYLRQHSKDFVGCVLSGPALHTALRPSAVRMAMARLISMLLPTLSALRLEPVGISRDPEEVRRYMDDPLVYKGPLSARLLVELFDALDDVPKLAPHIQLPLLLLHGGDDPLTSPEGSRLLHAHAASTDKTLRIYPGLYHEIFNEPERPMVFSEMFEWCEARLPKKDS